MKAYDGLVTDWAGLRKLTLEPDVGCAERQCHLHPEMLAGSGVVAPGISRMVRGSLGAGRWSKL